MKNLILKPDFKAYFWAHMLKSAIVPFIPAFIALVGAVVAGPAAFLVALAVFIGFMFLYLGVIAFFRYIQYQKESYEITADSIIAHAGSLFYEKETELSIKNITDIERIYPFIETNLFGTGKIKIESAGSTTTEVLLQSLDDAETVTKELELRMEKKGFNLSTEELVYQAKPSMIGVAIETVTFTFSALFSIFFFGIYIFSEAELSFDVISAIFSNPVLLCVIAAIVLPIYLVVIALKAMDMKDRIYSVYDGLIRYEEGFLTKHYAIIPTQNLADAAVRQDFIRRIFGIANVILSTRGTANDIKFSNIPDATALEESIDKTIALQKKHKAAQKDKTVASEHSGTHQKRIKDFGGFAKSYKVDLKFLLLSPLLGILVFAAVLAPIILIIGLAANELPLVLGISALGFGLLVLFIVAGTGIGQVIRYMATSYEIREDSIFEKFSFLSRYTKEFTLDKITAVKVTRGLTQRIFGVCTIEFFSIGSAQNIVFRDIKYSAADVKEIKGKLEVKEDAKSTQLEISPNFNLLSWSLASIPSLMVSTFILLAAGLMALAIGDFAITLYAIFLATIGLMFGIILGLHYLYQKSVSLVVTDDFLIFKGGIFTLIEHFADLDFVKNTTSKKFPGINQGIISFDVAGEVYVMGSQENKSQVAWTNTKAGQQNTPQLGNHNRITINYVDEVFEKADVVDELIAKIEGVKLDEPHIKDELAAASPSVIQAATGTLLVSLISFIGIPFLPITLPLAIWYESSKKYAVSSFRILFQRGIIYTYRTTIVAAQIDHIESSQNFVNQIFGTGNIEINTEGSTGVEMNIANIPAHKEFYSQVKDSYEK